MGRNRRPIRGGKRPTDNRHSKFQKPKKQKKGKFNIREASYIKERDAKNAEIEERRKKLQEQEAKKRRYESDSSDEDEVEDPMDILLSSFSQTNAKKHKVAIDSESDSDSEENTETEDECKNEDELNAKSKENLQHNYESEGDDEINEGNSTDSGEEKSEKLTSKLERYSTENCKNKKKNDENNIEGSDTDEDSEIEEENNIENTRIKLSAKDEDVEDVATECEDAGTVYISDPFSLHLNFDLSDDLYNVISSSNFQVNYEKLIWPTLGNIDVQIPKVPESSTTIKKTVILNDKKDAKSGEVPKIIDEVNWENLYIKSQITSNLTRANFANIQDSLETSPTPLTALQKELFSIINNYQDLLYCSRSFANEDEIRFTYCLHVVNHLLKTRTKILHHNAKLSKFAKLSMGEIPEEFRDQGLVRPKIVIIVPFRHSCLKIVETLIAILIGEDKGGSVMNKKRFMEDFGGSKIAMPRKNPKPEDYEMTFQGNTDDTFKIGISVTKKTLKLYSEFYSSDIIISSVLGLRMLVGAEGEEDRDYDFLASIELLIMDQADLFFMQNWDHLVHVLDHFHLTPKKSHDTDFSRVRSWSVNGWAKYYRQTLIFSGIQLPEIHAIFNKKCHNYAGKFKVTNPCISGSICQVIIQVPQVFHKFPASSYKHAIEARMEFFIAKILPQFKDSIMNHTLIFVPSYFDFVKIRNYFKKEELSFVQICEYTKDAKIARARDMFFHSDAHFMIYSERFHFFRRIKIKGIRHLIFFAPPTYPHFYAEMCNLMHDTYQNPKAGSEGNMTVTVLYSKYDTMQLSGIVGTERAIKMIASEKSTHMIVTGE